MSPAADARAVVLIDPEVCIGAGVCEELAPGLVALGADEVARPVPGAAITLGLAEELRARCPSGAIAVAVAEETR